MKCQRTHLIASSVIATGFSLWAVACAATEEPTYTPTGTTGSSGVTSTNGAAGPSVGPVTGSATTSPATAAGVTGTTGAAASTTGAASSTTGAAAATGVGGAAATTAAATTDASATATGTTGEVDFCLTRPTLAEPGITDFEDYDGTTAAADYGFTLYDDTTVQRYAGVYANSDGTGAPAFAMVAGNASSWAVSASNATAMDWGGGVGLWINCVNASSFTGVSLAVRGSSPTGMGTVALTIGETGSVSTPIALTETFTVHQLPFTMFTNTEVGATVTSTNGDSLTGMAVGASMSYVDDGTGMYVAEPGAYEVVVDDVTFY